MKLASFEADGARRFGVCHQQSIVDLTAAAAADRFMQRRLPVPGSLRQFLALGAPALQVAQQLTAAVRPGEPPDPLLIRPGNSVRLTAPVPDPAQIIAIGRNYLRPGRGRSDAPTSPRLFPKWPSTIIGSGQPIIRPAMTRKLDWEVELAVVIGRRAHKVSRADALDYVAGYTIVNDVSARDIQGQQPEQLAMAKNFRSFTPMGAVLVTAEEVPDPGALPIRCWVNDELMQDSSTSNLIFDVPELISTLSAILDLGPGDIISTGTPPGTGNGRTPPRYLQPGDQVRMQLGDLCELQNPVIDDTPAN